MDFDFTGRQFWISRSLIAQDHIPDQGDYKFSTGFLRFGVGFGCVFRIKDHLSNAFTVAEVDK
jgi:hypothetical protein